MPERDNLKISIVLISSQLIGIFYYFVMQRSLIPKLFGIYGDTTAGLIRDVITALSTTSLRFAYCSEEVFLIILCEDFRKEIALLLKKIWRKIKCNPNDQVGSATTEMNVFVITSSNQMIRN